MSYLTRVVWPYALLGAASSAISFVYYEGVGSMAPLSHYITNALGSLLKTFKLSPKKGVGQIITAVVNFMVTGALIGIAVYLSNRIAPIPQPQAIVSPVQRVAAAL